MPERRVLTFYTAAVEAFATSIAALRIARADKGRGLSR